MSSALHRMWYEGRWYQWLLLPLTILFYLVSALRRQLFRCGIKTTTTLPVPVIIVGNLSVGGNGKTPLVVALCEYLTRAGYKVGVVSRGYGAGIREFPHQLSTDDTAEQVGDEPLLIARRTGVPVVIDPVRPRAAQLLVAQNCDVIISDDGLQHYALGRDIECVVTDRRLFGNGKLLPMGPLREGLWRLASVDFLIVNQAQNPLPLPEGCEGPITCSMQLQPGQLVNVLDPAQQRAISDLETEPQVTAIAGIGDPPRFFNQLRAMGVKLDHCRALADHHAIGQQDIPSGCVIMTEKDAVKAVACAHQNCWYQPVDALLPDSFYTQLIERIARINKN